QCVAPRVVAERRAASFDQVLQFRQVRGGRAGRDRRQVEQERLPERVPQWIQLGGDVAARPGTAQRGQDFTQQVFLLPAGRRLRPDRRQQLAGQYRPLAAYASQPPVERQC